MFSACNLFYVSFRLAYEIVDGFFMRAIEAAKKMLDPMCYRPRCKIIINFKLKLIADQKTMACESGLFISHKCFSSAYQFQPFTNRKWPNTATSNRSEYERATSKIMKFLNNFERDSNGNPIIKYGMRDKKKIRINFCRLTQASFLFRFCIQNDSFVKKFWFISRFWLSFFCSWIRSTRWSKKQFECDLPKKLLMFVNEVIENQKNGKTMQKNLHDNHTSEIEIG